MNPLEDPSTTWTPPAEIWSQDGLPAMADPYYEDPYYPDPYAKM